MTRERVKDPLPLLFRCGPLREERELTLNLSLGGETLRLQEIADLFIAP